MKTILLIDDDGDDCIFFSHALASVSDHMTLVCISVWRRI